MAVVVPKTVPQNMSTLRPARKANPFPSLFNISVLQDPQPLKNSGASDDIDMDEPAAYAVTVLAVFRSAGTSKFSNPHCVRFKSCGSQ